MDMKRYQTALSIPKGARVRWYGSDTQDGHGGMAAEHRAEMQAIASQIAEQKIKEIVPQMAQDIYINSLKDILRGIQYDIETVVNIAFSDGRDVFTSSKARKAVSDAIYKEVIKGLANLKHTI